MQIQEFDESKSCLPSATTDVIKTPQGFGQSRLTEIEMETKNKTQGSDSNMSNSDGSKGGVARVPKSSGGERKGLSTKSLSLQNKSKSPQSPNTIKESNSLEKTINSINN
jgi:hypothetical protein